MYPQLCINLNKLRSNAEEVVERCHGAGIKVCAVVKGYWSDPVIVQTYIDGGADHVGSSRISQIAAMRKAGIKLPFILLRVPQLSELKSVAEKADISLQSDLRTMEELNRCCLELGKAHGVIIMADLGDLREGFWDESEFTEACLRVEKDMKGLKLSGVGVNLGCYGAIEPTPAKMEALAELARKVEGLIGRKLEIVSGGATSSYALVHKGAMPAGINHLRIGEGVSLAYDLPYIWGIKDMDYLYSDAFTLKAQVVEIRRKPSYPQGKFCIDAFGDLPVFEDKGVRTRAHAALGRADAGPLEKLRPARKGMQILGGSSDHIILDIEDCEERLQVGDTVEFGITYPNILPLTLSPDVEKVYE